MNAPANMAPLADAYDVAVIGAGPAGLAAAGPAVIESLESTILVPPGWQAVMDADGFVLMSHAFSPQAGRRPG